METSMKITFLKLTNFLGIFNGLNRRELEIDFTKGTNDITLLIGENGSGKSTILSTLHPFAGTYDDKSSIILPGRDGYKEIHIENGGAKYIIKHYYEFKKKTKTTKSFISVVNDDGTLTELNENGGVRTFEDAVKLHLDLVPSFLTLSRIGSNVSNFIDKKSTDRKKMISDFLPDIEEFEYSYKIINNKWTACKKELKSVSDQLAKIDDLDKLESRETSTIADIESLKELIGQYNASITEHRTRITMLDPDKEIRNTYKKLGLRKAELEHDLNLMAMEEIDFGDVDSLESVNTQKAFLAGKRQSGEQKLKTLMDHRMRLQDDLSTCKTDLEDKEDMLAKHTLDKNLSEYYELRDEYQSKIDGYQTFLHDHKELANYKTFTLEETNEYNAKFAELEKEMGVILEKYSVETLRSVEYGNINATNHELNELRRNQNILKNKLSDLTATNATLVANMTHVETLNKRPHDCQNDGCPFIKEALKHYDTESKLEANVQETTKLSEIINENDEHIERLNNIYQIFIDVNSCYNRIRSDLLLSKMHFFDLSIDEFVKEILLKSRDHIRDIGFIIDYVTVNTDLKLDSEMLKEINTNIVILENKTELINSIKNDITKLYNKKDNMERELLTLKDNIEHLEKVFTKLESYEAKNLAAEDYYTRLEAIADEIKAIDPQLVDMHEAIDSIRNSNRTIKASEASIEELEPELKAVYEVLDMIKFDIGKVNDFIATKEILDIKYNDLNTVRDALNPTKGIPLLFIETYLTKTKMIANSLLDVAFRGRFRIEDFVVTEKDFYIKLIKEDGVKLNDVIDASQGERALISLAISMALIQQSMRKYNILLLDEIDAELDSSNRKSFIEILEAQFEILGIEQCLMITHNNEFDTYNTNLLLLKDHGVDTDNKEYMSNKEIVFNLYDN